MAYGNKMKSAGTASSGSHTMPDGSKMTGSKHSSSSKPIKAKTAEIDLGDGSFNIKEGALSRQLGIPVKDNIPMSLLKRLVKVENGKKFMHQGKEKKMTPLLKRRVSLAITLKSRNKK